MHSLRSDCWLVLFSLTIAAIAIAQPPEPIFQGKPLGTWIKQLQSTKLGDRQNAAIALDENVGPAGVAAVPALIAALKDCDIIVCSRAAGALARLGPKAAPAVAALRAVLNYRGRGFVSRIHAA